MLNQHCPVDDNHDVINVDGNDIGTKLIYSYLYDWFSIDIWFTGRAL